MPSDKYCPPFTPMHEILTPTKGVDFSIEKFNITDEDVKYHFREDTLVAGKYMRLVHNDVPAWDSVIMSDTVAERRDNMPLLHRAKGHVLVAGLGLGMVLVPLMEKSDVTAITVVEKELEVAWLVWSQLRFLPGAEKVRLMVADIYDMKFMKPAVFSFNTIWFDIWDNYSSDTYNEVQWLRKFWDLHLADDGWMGSWKEQEMQLSHDRAREDDGWDT